MTLFAAEIDGFIEEGYVVVREAVPRHVVAEIRAAAVGLVPSDRPDGWRLGLASVYDLPILVRALSTAVRDAFDALVGQDAWHLAAVWGFPTRFPGPCPVQWHIDGDWFTHHLTSADQVLTPIFLWNDVGNDDSPTLLCPGSHGDVARFLRDAEPDGVPGEAIAEFVHSHLTVTRTLEAIGSAGDVIVCHPFLAHSTNPASPRKPRYISNVAVHGIAPLKLSTDGSGLSPVESAVVAGLRS